MACLGLFAIGRMVSWGCGRGRLVGSVWGELGGGGFHEIWVAVAFGRRCMDVVFFWK